MSLLHETSFALSHSMARKFIECATSHGVILPDHITARLCTRCSAPLIPSFTSMLRVCRRRGGVRGAGKPSEGQRRPTSEAVVHCRVCGCVSDKQPIPRKAASKEEIPLSSSKLVSKASTVSKHSSKAAKFNFADLLRCKSPATPAAQKAEIKPGRGGNESVVSLLDLEAQNRKKKKEVKRKLKQGSATASATPGNRTPPVPPSMGLGSLGQLFKR